METPEKKGEKRMGKFGKWQVLSLALAVCLGFSIGFNVYQHFSGSDSENAQFVFTWDVAGLEHTLKNFTWMRSSETGVFDCSEMSAYLWQYLTNRGWKCALVLGYYHQRYHAWLLVDTVDEFITPVESTTLRVIRRNDTDYEGYLQFKKFFPTLQDALDWNREDFDYWNSYPYSP